jgi:uncharacterized protein (TIGR03083 family)
MEIADHVACLAGEGAVLALAAERAGLDAPVPSCPGWRIRDLLGHLGFVHRWAAGYVATGRARVIETPGDEEIVRLAPADELLLGWFRAGHAALVSVLSAADPAVACWSFLAAPSPLAFWARRQAHETAIHRVDAQLAAAAVVPGTELDPFPPGLAADGIDELLNGFASRDPRSLSDSPATLVVLADDGGPVQGWTVVMGSDDAGVSRVPAPSALAGAGAAVAGAGPAVAGAGPAVAGAGPAVTAVTAGAAAAGEAYCEVRGPAPAVYLLLWNRGSPAGLDVRGDAGVLARWREKMRVRWS